MRDALDMESVPCAFVALDHGTWNACQIVFDAEL